MFHKVFIYIWKSTSVRNGKRSPDQFQFCCVQDYENVETDYMFVKYSNAILMRKRLVLSSLGFRATLYILRKVVGWFGAIEEVSCRVK